MSKPCENWNGEHNEEPEHRDGLKECPVCQSVFCGPCRKAIGDDELRCPKCRGWLKGK